MKIITEIAGSAENKIIYENRGKTDVFALPSVFGMEETRRRLKEAFAEERGTESPEPEKTADEISVPVSEKPEAEPAASPRRKPGTKGTARG